MDITFDNLYQQLSTALYIKPLPQPRFEKNLGRKFIFHYRSPNIIEVGRDAATAKRIQVLDDMTHVLVHIVNFMQGVEDHTPNQYHKHEFRDAALAIGMIVACHKTRGWGLTFSQEKDAKAFEKYRVPSEAARQRLAVAYEKMSLFGHQQLTAIQNELKSELSGKKPKQFLFRYQCRCEEPFNTIRSGRRSDGPHPLDVTCNICGAKFVISDK